MFSIVASRTSAQPALAKVTTSRWAVALLLISAFVLFYRLGTPKPFKNVIFGKARGKVDVLASRSRPEPDGAVSAVEKAAMMKIEARVRKDDEHQNLACSGFKTRLAFSAVSEVL